MSRIQKQKERLECILTPTELQDKGKMLAEKSQNKQGLEEEKKATSSSYKAKIDECDAAIGVLSLAIRTGKEYREVDCELRYNDPSQGLKTTYRMDTSASVKTETMTEDERCDLFINALGEDKENATFVFLDRKTLPLKEELLTDIDKKEFESQGWRKVYEGIDKEMIRYVMTEEFEYMMYKSGTKFSIWKKAVVKPTVTEKETESVSGQPLFPESISALDDGTEVVATCKYADSEEKFVSYGEDLFDAGWDVCPMAKNETPDELLSKVADRREEYIVLSLVEDNKVTKWELYYRLKNETPCEETETNSETETETEAPVAEPVTSTPATKRGRKKDTAKTTGEF